MKPTAVPTLDAETLADLARLRAPHGISVLLPPTGPEEARITVRNLLREAETRLVAAGVRASDARVMVGQAEGVLDDHELLMRPKAHAALYIDANGPIRMRGPKLGAPLVVVGPRFQVKHLLDCVPDPQYGVLALSRKASRMFVGDSAELAEVTSGGFPVAMDEVLRYDDREPQLQSHGSSRRGAGAVVASFHGQGGRREQGEDLLRYLRAVESALGTVLTDELLVLAGTDELTAAFRRISTYPRIADGDIAGSGERLGPHELATGAAPIVATTVAAGREGVRSRLAERSAGGLGTGDVAEALTAALDGRIEALLVAGDIELWGTFDPEHRSVTATDAEAGEDLLNVAAIETWRHGGHVYVVPGDQIPGPLPMAALFRY